MLKFSNDPDVAEQQMNAIIFYLTAFGYIDGDFDSTEKTFVKIYIRQLVNQRARDAMPDGGRLTIETGAVDLDDEYDADDEDRPRPGHPRREE